jgi:hypothetical protein
VSKIVTARRRAPRHDRDMRPLALCLLAACAGRAPTPAPFTLPATCSGPEYRALDFWLGEWEVRNADGSLDGTNEITPALGGCAVREAWTDVDGHNGESLFFYDRALARWKQVWVTTEGTWKEKTQIDAPAGGLRFQGRVPRPRGGAVLDRTTLSALPDGGVRQRIEVSRDDGATWEAWEGLYARRRPACDGPSRELDFWVGDWDLTIRARKAPDRDDWEVARGRNQIARVLGGCSIEESFTADGPDKPWAGKSLSLWIAAEKRWRQTWVDDDGSYLTFAGGMEGKDMVLLGEPKARRMRMVFTDIARNSLLWRWEATTDGGKTWSPMLVIEYKRRG